MKTKTNIMKTTLLFSAALLITAASFAQTTVNNKQESKSLTTAQASKSGAQLNSSSSTSSSTTIQSDAVIKTKKTAYAETEKGKQDISAEKKAVIGKAKAEEKETKSIVSKDQSSSVEGHSSLKVTAGDEGNKTDENSSLNSQTKLSGSGLETMDQQLEKKGKTSVKSASTVAIENSDVVKGKASKAENKMGKTVKTTAKPKPIKMNTQVKANTAIKIR
jgi:hypothetical protein